VEGAYEGQLRPEDMKRHESQHGPDRLVDCGGDVRRPPVRQGVADGKGPKCGSPRGRLENGAPLAGIRWVRAGGGTKVLQGVPGAGGPHRRCKRPRDRIVRDRRGPGMRGFVRSRQAQAESASMFAGVTQARDRPRVTAKRRAIRTEPTLSAHPRRHRVGLGPRSSNLRPASELASTKFPPKRRCRNLPGRGEGGGGGGGRQAWVRTAPARRRGSR